jgi:hypothetical protein
MTPERVETIMRNELRVALVHEHAHVLVAEHLGMTGTVNVKPNPNGSSALDGERFWLGHAQIFGIGGAPANVKRLVGLAGLVAEQVYYDEDVLAAGIMAEVDLIGLELSETDAALVGHYSEEDVAKTLELVRRHWSEIVRRTSRVFTREIGVSP